MDRVSLWLTGAIALVVVIGGVLQIRSYVFVQERSVREPARQQVAAALEEQLEVSETESSLTDLQGQDTDSDSLSDFDELYVYNTSPYLADTDSDGVDDAQELVDGTQPTCPEGADCEQARVDPNQATDAEQAFGEFNPNEFLPTDEDGNVDTEELRNLLRDQGVTEDVLAEIEDEQLVEAYNETVALTNSGGNSIANVEQQADEIKNLPADEKRQILIETGASAAEVNALSDEELDDLFSVAVDDALDSVLQQDAIPNQSEVNR